MRQLFLKAKRIDAWKFRLITVVITIAALGFWLFPFIKETIYLVPIIWVLSRAYYVNNI